MDNRNFSQPPLHIVVDGVRSCGDQKHADSSNTTWPAQTGKVLKKLNRVLDAIADIRRSRWIELGIFSYG